MGKKQSDFSEFARRKLPQCLIWAGISTAALSLNCYVGPMELQAIRIERALLGDSCESTNRMARRWAARALDRQALRVRRAEVKAGSIGGQAGAFQILPTRNTDILGTTASWSWRKVAAEDAAVAAGHLSFLVFLNSAQELLDIDMWRIGRKSHQWDMAGRQRKIFLRNFSVKRLNQMDLELSLDVGDARGQEAAIQKAIEDAWSTNRHHLFVRWVTNDPAAYRITIKRAGSEHYVNYQTKTITLLSAATNGVIAHEIGHVLGFDDHYKRYWSQVDCDLRGIADEHDIMASSAYPHALPFHWNILDRAYPIRRRQGAKPLPRLFAYRPLKDFSPLAQGEAAAQKLY